MHGCWSLKQSGMTEEEWLSRCVRGSALYVRNGMNLVAHTTNSCRLLIRKSFSHNFTPHSHCTALLFKHPAYFPLPSSPLPPFLSFSALSVTSKLFLVEQLTSACHHDVNPHHTTPHLSNSHTPMPPTRATIAIPRHNCQSTEQLTVLS